MIYVDSMHGKLARILRVFGVSCVYIDPSIDDNKIIQMLGENDVLVTSDIELSKRVRRSILLRDQNIKTNIQIIVSNGIVLDIDNPYCYVCNIKLERHGNKYRCNTCGKWFWRGKQWRNLREYLPDCLKESLQT
ncbi:MAG: hypothetical protein NZ908_01865 [Candidatus Micrarchaeota archaeon]|nr:hypothetical protein [Candidatus Micrarchaeota archaeon]MCX8154738.1 hypothetical protein [Candidatus Micrarchaeota archaeon]